jgi:hypothetical protein
MTMMMAVVAVPSTLDHPEQPLRLMEESPDLANVHVCPAFFSTTTRLSIQSYETSREKLLVLANLACTVSRNYRHVALRPFLINNGSFGDFEGRFRHYPGTGIHRPQ